MQRAFFTSVLCSLAYVIAFGCKQNERTQQKDPKERGPSYDGSNPNQFPSPTGSSSGGGPMPYGNCPMPDFKDEVSGTATSSGYLVDIAMSLKLVPKSLMFEIDSSLRVTPSQGGPASQQFTQRRIKYLSTPWKNFFAQTNMSQVNCSLLLASSLTDVTKSLNADVLYDKEIRFEPAIPYFIIPTTDPAELNKELASPVTFTGIKAVVVKFPAEDNTVQVGQTYTGEVRISSETPKFGAAHAFRLSMNFGSQAVTGSLGMAVETIFHFSVGNLIAIEAPANATSAASILK